MGELLQISILILDSLMSFIRVTSIGGVLDKASDELLFVSH
mgnify:CR=1 FL=1